MIRFEEIYENARKAYINKEFFEFISGQNGYDCPVLDVPTAVPTDWNAIIPNGIYKLYRTEIFYREGIKNDFFDAIRRLIDGTDVEIWEAAYVLFVQLKSQARGTAPFMIDDVVIEAFRKRFDERKMYLSSNFEYDGQQFPNGLLGDIERLDNILNSKYSIGMMR